jgi:phosphate transport system protein
VRAHRTDVQGEPAAIPRGREEIVMAPAPPHPHRPLLDEELGRLRAWLARMGELVDAGIGEAMAALAARDVDRCTAVVAGDAALNALHHDVRELCFTILLTQTPLGGDLRETMGLLHMASELERMGDHCVSIAKLAREVAHQPELTTSADLGAIGRPCQDQVRAVLAAMIARRAEQARQVAAGDDAVDRAYREAFDLLVQTISTDRESAYVGTQLLFIAHHLERIADRVTNIAEDLVFLETGVIEELG